MALLKSRGVWLAADRGGAQCRADPGAGSGAVSAAGKLHRPPRRMSGSARARRSRPLTPRPARSSARSCRRPAASRDLGVTADAPLARLSRSAAVRKSTAASPRNCGDRGRESSGTPRYFAMAVRGRARTAGHPARPQPLFGIASEKSAPPCSRAWNTASRMCASAGGARKRSGSRGGHAAASADPRAAGAAARRRRSVLADSAAWWMSPPGTWPPRPLNRARN